MARGELLYAGAETALLTALLTALSTAGVVQVRERWQSDLAVAAQHCPSHTLWRCDVATPLPCVPRSDRCALGVRRQMGQPRTDDDRGCAVGQARHHHLPALRTHR
jgi:hypothetical protein